MSKKPQQENGGDQPQERQVLDPAASLAISEVSEVSEISEVIGHRHAPAGLELLTHEDLAIPRLILVQPTSQVEDGVAGSFYLNLTGEQMEEIEIVFLRLTKGRMLPSEILGDKPLCGSPDRVRPSPRFENPISEKCEGCSMSVPVLGSRFSACTKNYSLLCVFADTRIPFWWTVKATALWPTQKVLTQFAFQDRNPYEAKVKVRTLLVTKPGKKYFVPVYGKLEWLSEEEKREFAVLYQRYAGENPDRIFEPEEEAKPFDWEGSEEETI